MNIPSYCQPSCLISNKMAVVYFTSSFCKVDLKKQNQFANLFVSLPKIHCEGKRILTFVKNHGCQGSRCTQFSWHFRKHIRNCQQKVSFVNKVKTKLFFSFYSACFSWKQEKAVCQGQCLSQMILCRETVWLVWHDLHLEYFQFYDCFVSLY